MVNIKTISTFNIKKNPIISGSHKRNVFGTGGNTVILWKVNKTIKLRTIKHYTNQCVH